MSYARSGQDDSDVYVYPTEVGGRRAVECCCCHTAYSTDDAVKHQREHIAAGDVVPSYVIDRINAGQFCETGNPL
jgi:hypothetical protein